MENSGHNFVITTFGGTTFCSVCKDHIWGLAKQGYKCSQCQMPAHKKCVDKIRDIKCPEANRENTVNDRPHSFKPHNYKVPTFCDHCGTMLVGLYRQGCRCEYCPLNVHDLCQTKVTRPCINH